jgi:hypothetical protein
MQWNNSKLYSVIRKSLRNVRPLRYSSRDGHAEGEHVNRGRNTASFCPTLKVLDSCFLLCLSWLLGSRVRTFRRDLWITLYNGIKLGKKKHKNLVQLELVWPYEGESGFGVVVVSMLASGTQDSGFKPGRSRLIFRAKKSTACLPSEGK